MLLIPLIPFAITMQTAMPVEAWGLQTHQFIVTTAMEQISNESWLDAFEYYTPELISGCTAPDQVFQNWTNHLYYPETGEHNAPLAAQQWYDYAKANFTAGNWEDGFFAAGVMTHYFTDPHIPVHTDLLWDGHSAYESDINSNLGGLELTNGTETLIANVTEAVIIGATYAHQFYDDIYAAYPANESEAMEDSTILSITEDCLSRAIIGTLSLFYTLADGITAPDVVYTYNFVALFDYAHANDYTDDATMTSIEQTLARKHFEKFDQTTAITAGDLTDVDLLVVTCGLNEYTADELTAITNWAATGNKSIIITSRGDYSIAEDTTRPNQILEAISSNIRVNDDDVHMLGTYATHYNDLYDIPDPADTLGLTASVNSLTLYSPSSLYFIDEGPVLPIIMGVESTWQRDRAAPNITVIYDDTEDGKNGEQIPLVAVEEIGELRVLVSGTTFFSNFDYGKTALFSNIVLLENFLGWAIGDRSEDNIADVDEVGPRIGAIEVSPVNPVANESVTVSATITDTNDVDEVILQYNSTSGIVEVSMTATGDTYSVVIPELFEGRRYFRIIATDTDGNEAIRGDYTIVWGVEPTDAPLDMPILLIVVAFAAIAVVVVLVFVIKRR